MADVCVVIPTLNEARRLPALLHDLRALRVTTDVVVADGGSGDGTRDVARAAGAHVVQGPPGRGGQMNAGAAQHETPWLCFLHADVRLPAAARRDLEGTLADPSAGAAVWGLALDAAGWWFRAIEWGARVRDRVGGLPYGDQGLLIRRELFDAVGGFAELPLMEDVDMIRRLRRRARVRRLPSNLVVSSRRYRREGPVRGWIRNASLIALYLAGVAPVRLARWYRPEPS